ncbi:hypothetical protein NC997_20000 [Trichocoleus sp. DQ-A2]|uniref:hypothetical protein n=1 Tax=Trichocoleus sp. DQ-A2 TaxID=2933924 RepID=UPI0019C21BA7|nr:hypothetical protein [Coleofasciculus sp. FACHB-T130]
MVNERPDGGKSLGGYNIKLVSGRSLFCNVTHPIHSRLPKRRSSLQSPIEIHSEQPTPFFSIRPD